MSCGWLTGTRAKGVLPRELDRPAQILDVAGFEGAVLAVEDDEVPSQHGHELGERWLSLSKEAAEHDLACLEFLPRLVVPHRQTSRSRVGGGLVGIGHTDGSTR